MPTAPGALSQLARAWTRFGAYLSVVPSRAPVDLEALIVATARAGPDDERLFVVAVSWLAVHHDFVNGRRLAVLAGELASSRRSGAHAEASAVLGAMLTWADDLSGGKAEPLRAAASRCRRLRTPQAFYRVVREMPSVARQVRRAAVPRFEAWGLWHDGEAAKPEAVRPASWLLRHTPELRIRALVGPTLEADLLAAAMLGLPAALPGEDRLDANRPGHGAGVAVRDVSRALRVSYAAAHQGADKLVRRGALRRERQGVRQVLRPTAVAARLLA